MARPCRGFPLGELNAAATRITTPTRRKRPLSQRHDPSAMPSTILDEILHHKKEHVRRERRRLSASEFTSFEGYHKSRLPFAEALKQPGKVSVIAEFKRASPSKGAIRADADPARIIGSYIENGASAISVLTDEPFFKGGPQDLITAAGFSPVPLLRKDFIVDPWQVAESRAYGADAVLLILAALEPAQLAELMHAAAESGLGVFLECEKPEDLEIALPLRDGFQAVGVNNRDLRTFKTDPDRGIQILGAFPQDLTRVSESGLRTPDDMVRLWLAGIDAALIGEHFMRQADPGGSLRSLLEGTQARIDREREREQPEAGT